MGGYFSLAVGVTLVACWFLWRSIASLRRLRELCDQQLADLLSHLNQRRLVLSHLVDSLTESKIVDLAELQETSELAQRAVDGIDAHLPESSALHHLSRHERRVAAMSKDLVDYFDDQEQAVSKGIAACLDGLRDVTRQIVESVSTYNSSVITYRESLNTRFRWIQWLHAATGHCELDLDPPHSSDSSHTVPRRTA